MKNYEIIGPIGTNFKTFFLVIDQSQLIVCQASSRLNLRLALSDNLIFFYNGFRKKIKNDKDLLIEFSKKLDFLDLNKIKLEYSLSIIPVEKLLVRSGNQIIYKFVRFIDKNLIDTLKRYTQLIEL